MRYELKSIPLWPVTRVAFFVNLVVGFVIGLILAVFMMPIVTGLATLAAYDAGEFDYDSGPLGALTMMVPFLAALWSAFFNTVMVIIFVLSYNLVVRFVGGIELNLEAVDLTSLVSELTTRPSEPDPEPSPQEPAPPPPPPAATGRPVPPPPVITQPEPRTPDIEPSAPTDKPSDAGENEDKNINE